jgi:hypothetical protein
MKKRTTRVALVVAMKRAMKMLAAPRSMRPVQMVRPVNISRRAQTSA